MWGGISHSPMRISQLRRDGLGAFGQVWRLPWLMPQGMYQGGKGKGTILKALGLWDGPSHPSMGIPQLGRVGLARFAQVRELATPIAHATRYIPKTGGQGDHCSSVGLVGRYIPPLQGDTTAWKWCLAPCMKPRMVLCCLNKVNGAW